MKKFITYISMQTKDLKKLMYSPMDGELKTLSEKRKSIRGGEFYTSYPVMCLVDDYVEKDDRIEMICMLAENNESVKRNFEVLKNELSDLAGEIGFTFNVIPVSVQPDEIAESHIQTFKSLIDLINDDDEVFACCTFGTKPIPIIEMMALNYSYRLKKNVTVRSIAYGAPDWENGDNSGKIFDIRELFYMEQMVNQIARAGKLESEKLLRQLLGFDLE